MKTFFLEHLLPLPLLLSLVLLLVPIFAVLLLALVIAGFIGIVSPSRATRLFDWVMRSLRHLGA